MISLYQQLIAKLTLLRDTLLLRKPAEAVALPISVTPMPENNVDTLVPWTGKENCRHNVRVLCDLEGLTEDQKNDMSSTVNCESGYNPNICNLNFTDGTTGECLYPNLQAAIATHVAQGKKVASIDYGICQWNDYYHGSEITPDQSVNDPEMAVRLMCKYVKEGLIKEWVCYSKNLFSHYTP